MVKNVKHVYSFAQKVLISNDCFTLIQGPTGQTGLQGPRGPPGDTVRLL